MQKTNNVEHEQFFKFFEISSDLMVIFDANGCFKKVNPFFLQILGYSEEDLLKKPFIDFIHPEDRQSTLDEIAKAIKSGFSMNFENRYLCKDGSIRWLSWRANYNAKEGITYATARDITDRKIAEKKLQESEKFYRSLLKMMNGFAYCRMLFKNGKPHDFIYLMVNEAFEKQTGLKDVVGKKVSEVIPGILNSNPEVIETYGRVVKTGESEKFETFLEALQLWFSITVFSPEPEHFVAVFENITASKKMEEKLRLKNYVFDISIAANSVADAKGIIIQANKTFLDLWGFSILEDVIGRPISSFFMNIEEAAAVIDVLNKNNKWEGDFTARRKDGSVFTAHGLASVICNAHGEMIGYQSSVLDFTDRNQRANDLRLHSEVLHKMAEGVVLTRASDDVIVYTNSKFEQMFNYSSGELNGKHISIVNAPTEISPEETARQIIQSLDDRGFWNGEVLNIKKDGTPFWCSATVSSFEHSQFGNIWISIQQDISERKRMEDDLRESNARFEGIVKNVSMGIYLNRISADGVFRFVYVSPQLCQLLNITREKLLSDSEAISSFVHPDDLSALNAMNDEAVKCLKPIIFEGRYIIKGETRWFHLESNPTALPNGESLWSGVLYEITKRKQNEEELRVSIQVLDSVINSSPNFIFVTDRQHRYTLVNDAYATFLKKPRTEIIGRTHREFYPESQTEAFIVANESIMTNGKMIQVDETVLDRNLMSIKFAMRDVQGNVNGICGVITDITDRKIAEGKMLQTQKMESIGFLASGIAHDFNNLLSAMMGNVSLIQMQLPDNHPTVKYIEPALSAMKNAALLTKQLLAYSGKGQFQMLTIDMVEMVRENLKLIEISVPKNVSTKTKFPPTPVYIIGDPGQLEQVVMNLIINAGEAIGEKQGVVKIEISTIKLKPEDLSIYRTLVNTSLEEGEYALLQVSDNGIGMSEEILTKIFDPFFTTKFVGRGLGLSAVLGILRSHKGAITVESTKGVGTIFRVIMPLVSAPKPNKEVSSKQILPSSTNLTSILVIDDEQQVLDTILDILEVGNYLPLTQKSPLDGIKLYETLHIMIPLVILDLTMPEMNGKEVLVRLQKINPNVKVILSSGYSEEEAKRRLGNVTASAFIQKPYDAKTLLSLVDQVMHIK